MCKHEGCQTRPTFNFEGLKKPIYCFEHKKSKQEEWKKRLLTLVTQIEYWLQNRTDKTVEAVELFYDKSNKI